MDNNQQLQQSINTCTIIGKLKEKKIDFGIGKESEKAYAKGTLTVVVNTPDGINEIKVSVMQMALKKDGGENELYKGLQTINNEYKTIVDHGEELADTIQITGSLEMNDYYNKNKDEVSSYLQVKGLFIKRVDATAKHKAEFTIGGFIETITDKEDGTVDVAMISIVYGGKALPITVTVPNDIVNAFKSMCYVQCTANINFDMINAVEISKNTVDVGFGRAREEIAERKIRLNKVFGGSVLPVEYTADQILQVKNIRQQMLETLLIEGREKTNTQATTQAPISGFGQGFGAAAGATATTTTTNTTGFNQGFGQGFDAAAGATNPFAPQQ